MSEGEPRPRRPRYAGTHPRRFEQKYKELDPERYANEAEKVKGRGQTPAGTHRPILVDEILARLQPQPGQTGWDATLGWGGHSAELLTRVQPGGLLVATDLDPHELPRSEQRLRALGFAPETLVVRRQNFALAASLTDLAPQGFDFVLADFGVSSMQLDTPERGFSFKVAAPLDLRLDPTQGQPAAALLRDVSPTVLEGLLTDYADEPHAARIAKALCDRRGAVRSTIDLVNIVKKALAGRVNDEDAVKKTLQRTFQALRIAVNRELESLDQFLAALPKVLAPGGRVALLTFHSGEESRVRRAFDAGKTTGVYQQVSGEPLRASAAERYANPRSKSARLHWAQAVLGVLLCFGLMVPAGAQQAAPIHWKAVLASGWSSDDEGELLENWDNARDALHQLLRGRGLASADITLLTSQPELLGTESRGAPLRTMNQTTLADTLERLDLRPGDGLLLFLTSHGDKGEGLSLEDDGAGEYDVLRPTELKAMLDASVGDLPAVVLISACFSGQFLVPGVTSPHRVVLTAARFDRSSFGCGAGTSLPEWDESLIRKWTAAPAGLAWAELARQVERDIATKEKNEHEADRSYPQFAIGNQVKFTVMAKSQPLLP